MKIRKILTHSHAYEVTARIEGICKSLLETQGRISWANARWEDAGMSNPFWRNEFWVQQSDEGKYALYSLARRGTLDQDIYQRFDAGSQAMQDCHSIAWSNLTLIDEWEQPSCFITQKEAKRLCNQIVQILTEIRKVFGLIQESNKFWGEHSGWYEPICDPEILTQYIGLTEASIDFYQKLLVEMKSRQSLESVMKTYEYRAGKFRPRCTSELASAGLYLN